MNVKKVMKIVENKMELKKSFTYSQKEVDCNKEKAELKKSQKFKPKDTSEIEKLSKQMTELTLLNSAMLVLNTAHKDPLLFVEQALNAAKRIRIDDLLNKNFSPVPKSAPRAKELKEKVSNIGRHEKKKCKAVVNPIFPEQIMELHCHYEYDNYSKIGLSVSYFKFKPKECINPVEGPDIIVKAKVILNISFAEDVNIAVKFHVLATCAVPIILGRDVCQALKSNLNYEEETCRESLSEQFGDEPILDELFDEESDSSEDEESDSTALFLNLNQHEIIGEGLPQIPYLGYLVTNKGFLPDPKKIEALVGRNPPKNVKEVKSFVCLGSYFRKFLERYSDVVEPIQALVKKGARWEWTSECQESFQIIKSMLMNAPILKQPEQNKKFVLFTVASSVAVRAVLEQGNDDGELKPVAYYWRKLESAERNFKSYEREGLALVSAIKNFRPYLLGRRFVVFTDNSTIASIFKQR
ncbi:Retrovirus-related Pol polyprotein from transposon [Smittium culicis]|uniref:Retrovirus-related Pol polyprotein from transposon n=1 Tax=Smittium culicis TaxID=133412 RepID=A0A1R1YKB2_9FUNG|nr:Retrovirus-related Pol polyprotein from transposon [Smittium culicis]